MTSSIHYKFGASLDYRTLQFDGLSISVKDCKREICLEEKIKAESFDLKLDNAHTKRSYTGDETLIPRNSSIIVMRVPRENAEKLPKIQGANSGLVSRGVTVLASQSPSRVDSVKEREWVDAENQWNAERSRWKVKEREWVDAETQWNAERSRWKLKERGWVDAESQWNAERSRWKLKEREWVDAEYQWNAERSRWKVKEREWVDAETQWNAERSRWKLKEREWVDAETQWNAERSRWKLKERGWVDAESQWNAERSRWKLKERGWVDAESQWNAERSRWKLKEREWVDAEYQWKIKEADRAVELSRSLQKEENWEKRELAWKKRELDWNEREVIFAEEQSGWLEKQRNKENEWRNKWRNEESEWKKRENNALHELRQVVEKADSEKEKLLSKVAALKLELERLNDGKSSRDSLLSKLSIKRKELRKTKECLRLKNITRKRQTDRLNGTPSSRTGLAGFYSTPRKRRVYSSLGKSGANKRVSEMVDFLRVAIGEELTDDHPEQLQKIMEKVTRSLKVDDLIRVRLTPEQDVMISEKYFTSTSRDNIKRDLIKLNRDLDIFCPTHKKRSCEKELLNTIKVIVLLYDEVVRKYNRGRKAVEDEDNPIRRKNKKPLSRRQLVESGIMEEEEVEGELLKSRKAVLVTTQNICEVFYQRIMDLENSDRLELNMGCKNPETGESEIWVAFCGDKGDDLTKLCLMIANVRTPNSRDNLQLLSLYQGDDSRSQLENKASSVFEQLKELKYVELERNGRKQKYPIRIFMSSDYKFVYAMYGHQGASATHNCLFGYRRKGITYGELVQHGYTADGQQTVTLMDEVCPPRTLNQMKFDCRTSHNYNLTSEPLLDIPVEQIVIAPMHTIMGASNYSDEALRSACMRQDMEDAGMQWLGGERECKSALKDTRKKIITLIRLRLPYCQSETERRALMNEKRQLCDYAKKLNKIIRLEYPFGRKLDSALRSLGLIGTFYHAKTGNQVRKMLSDGIPQKIWQAVGLDPGRNLDIMYHLGNLMTLSAARFLRHDEIELLEESVDGLKAYMALEWPERPITPKLHAMFHHLVPFVKKWKTWGLMSEQAIEAIHPKVNNLRVRYAALPLIQRYKLIYTQ